MGNKTKTKQRFGSRRRSSYNTGFLFRGNRLPTPPPLPAASPPLPPSPPPMAYPPQQQHPSPSSASTFIENSESVVTPQNVMSVGSELCYQFTTQMDVSMNDDSYDELEVLDEALEELDMATLNQIFNFVSQVQHEVNEANCDQDNVEVLEVDMDDVIELYETHDENATTNTKEELRLKDYEGFEITKADTFLSVIKSIKHVPGKYIIL